jgi:hypothetical protein
MASEVEVGNWDVVSLTGEVNHEKRHIKILDSAPADDVIAGEGFITFVDFIYCEHVSEM